MKAAYATCAFFLLGPCLYSYDGSAIAVLPGFAQCDAEYVMPVFCNVGAGATEKSPAVELYRDGVVVQEALIPVLEPGECRGAGLSPIRGGAYRVHFYQAPGWPFLNGEGWSDVCLIKY